MKKPPQVKLWAVMETFHGDIVLRQEVCVFDNYAKPPKGVISIRGQLDMSEVWQQFKKEPSFIGGMILGKYQEEAHEKVMRKVKRKVKKPK